MEQNYDFKSFFCWTPTNLVVINSLGFWERTLSGLWLASDKALMFSNWAPTPWSLSLDSYFLFLSLDLYVQMSLGKMAIREMHFLTVFGAN